jgi:hypothetical protein
MSKAVMAMGYKTTAEMCEWPHERGMQRLRIAAVEEEVVDGEPVIVLYFKDHPDGLILDKDFAGQLTQALGPHPLVERYFREH